MLADDAQRSTADTIVKERIAILTQMIDITKKEYEAGRVPEAQVFDTTIELYSLNRDSSKTHREQISWQERIIAIEKEKKAVLERLVVAGMAEQVDVLRATERVLAAEQKRLELVAIK
jgi:outer membrane protein TolC